MKNYIKPLSLFFVGTFLILVVYGSDTLHPYASPPHPTSGAISAAMKIPDLCQTIPLPEKNNVYEYVYNAVNNSLSAICISDGLYQLYRFDPQAGWSPSSHWKIPEQRDLLHFVYGSDGTLYACMQGSGEKTIRQSFVRLGRRGTISDVMLHSLDKVPKTNLDRAMQKKGGHAPHDITGIRFSGTALAVSYHNYAVKFYNIAEGRAFGTDSLTGETHQALFYKYHYLTSGSQIQTFPLQLWNYDIRTGELDHTMTLSGASIQEHISTASGFWLSNYREKVYLLSEDGLFTSLFQDSLFTKILDRQQLTLPEGSQIRYFQAARDDVLYIAYLDETAQEHLIRLALPVS